MTPLHLAAESGHIKIVDYLYDQGADINIEDNSGVILCILITVSNLLYFN